MIDDNILKNKSDRKVTLGFGERVLVGGAGEEGTLTESRDGL